MRFHEPPCSNPHHYWLSASNGKIRGVALGKTAMQAVEKRLERHPALPKYDILINPAPTS
jgi:hypothetical protein